MSDPPEEDGQGYVGWRAGDKDDSPLRDTPSAARFVGGMYIGRTDRGFEWRDGLGCYWFACVLVVAVMWGWLNSIGLKPDVVNGVCLAALVGLAILFFAAARKARPPSN